MPGFNAEFRVIEALLGLARRPPRKHTRTGTLVVRQGAPVVATSKPFPAAF